MPIAIGQTATTPLAMCQKGPTPSAETEAATTVLATQAAAGTASSMSAAAAVPSDSTVAAVLTAPSHADISSLPTCQSAALPTAASPAKVSQAAATLQLDPPGMLAIPAVHAVPATSPATLQAAASSSALSSSATFMTHAGRLHPGISQAAAAAMPCMTHQLSANLPTAVVGNAHEGRTDLCLSKPEASAALPSINAPGVERVSPNQPQQQPLVSVADCTPTRSRDTSRPSVCGIVATEQITTAATIPASATEQTITAAIVPASSQQALSVTAATQPEPVNTCVTLTEDARKLEASTGLAVLAAAITSTHESILMQPATVSSSPQDTKDRPDSSLPNTASVMRPPTGTVSQMHRTDTSAHIAGQQVRASLVARTLVTDAVTHMTDIPAEPAAQLGSFSRDAGESPVNNGNASQRETSHSAVDLFCMVSDKESQECPGPSLSGGISGITVTACKGVESLLMPAGKVQAVTQTPPPRSSLQMADVEHDMDPLAQLPRHCAPGHQRDAQITVAARPAEATTVSHCAGQAAQQTDALDEEKRAASEDACATGAFKSSEITSKPALSSYRHCADRCTCKCALLVMLFEVLQSRVLQ